MTNASPARATCQEMRPLLGALIDGELNPATSDAVEMHLRKCHACWELFADQLATSAATLGLRQHLVAPPGLRARIEQQIESTQVPFGGRRARSFAMLGMVAAIVVLMIGATFGWRTRIDSESALLAAARTHQQKTLAARPVTFESSDPLAIAAWARTSTGREIEVPSLAESNYTLLGSRLEPSIGRNAVSLVYQSPAGRLTCTVLSGTIALPQRVAASTNPPVHYLQKDGIASAGWSDGDSTYLLSGNVDLAGLLDIARLAARQN